MPTTSARKSKHYTERTTKSPLNAGFCVEKMKNKLKIYIISADGGKTFTQQHMTETEAKEERKKGYLITEIDGKHIAIINGKIIKAQTMEQVKRLASIEANKRFNTIDYMYLLRIIGTEPIIYTRFNKKAPNNTIQRGDWI